MSHPGNKAVRLQRRIGAALLGLTMLGVAASGAGLVFPDAVPAERITVEFGVGAKLDGEAGAGVAAAANALLDRPEAIAVITGHTGAQGDAAANLKLSQDRAEAVRAALVAAGIPDDRILTNGVGGTVAPDPVEGETEAALAQRTKRAEIRIVERRLLAETALR